MSEGQRLQQLTSLLHGGRLTSIFFRERTFRAANRSGQSAAEDLIPLDTSNARRLTTTPALAQRLRLTQSLLT